MYILIEYQGTDVDIISVKKDITHIINLMDIRENKKGYSYKIVLIENYKTIHILNEKQKQYIEDILKENNHV